jgi:opacity protein-like surface antigen
MKKLLIVIVLVLLCAAPGWAQNKIKPIIYVGGGLGMPLSPTLFSDYWKMGFGFGGGLGLQFNPQVEIIGRFHYNTFPLDDDKLLSDAGVSGSSVTIDGLDFQSLEFGVDLKYIFKMAAESKFKPYMVTNVGFANVKFTDVTITGDGGSITLPASSISETDFTFAPGLGFDYMFAPKVGMWIDVRYALVLTEGETTSYLPIKAGLKLELGQ